MGEIHHEGKKCKSLHKTFIQCLVLEWYALFSHVVFVKLVRTLQLPFLIVRHEDTFSLKTFVVLDRS